MITAGLLDAAELCSDARLQMSNENLAMVLAGDMI